MNNRRKPVEVSLRRLPPVDVRVIERQLRGFVLELPRRKAVGSSAQPTSTPSVRPERGSTAE